MPARKGASLEEALVDLEAAMKKGDANVAKSLRPAASRGVVARLAKVAGALGDELAIWFAWHDGQSGFTSIGPSTSERLLSSAQASAAWTFLNEEGHAPWRSTWLPIMENGGGDYVVYDRKDGRLLRYHHEDRGRPKVAASLAAWANGVAAEWRAAVQSAAPAAVAPGWKPVASPKKSALAKKPAGTAYFFRATVPQLGKGVFHLLFWKKEPQSWYQAANSTLERCWLQIANNLHPRGAMPDLGAEFCMAADKVFADGASAPHVGLYERHFAKPPFPKTT